MNIKDKYEQFKQWQLEPFDYGFDDSHIHVCNNCGNSFNGKFCPHCSQNGKYGRITWKSVALSIGEVWGMHNRSLLFSIIQLLLRPGYFISDYINGKRQVSFPPVKMLVLVALLGVLVDHLTVFNGFMTFEIKKHNNLIFDDLIRWFNTHPDAMSIAMGTLLVIPCYIIFRHAPRNSFHTIPQGFFIQVFIAVFYLLINMLYDITSWAYFIFIINVIFIITTYRQLFGYGIWGTLWRYIMVIVCAGVLILSLVSIDYSVHNMFHRSWGEMAGGIILSIIGIAVLSLLLLICHLINIYTSTHRQKASKPYLPCDFRTVREPAGRQDAEPNVG